MKYYPNALLIGTRDFSHPNMPNGNRFANRFSNFWFMLQTGIKLPDTQTGFRLYPLHGMGNMRLFTHRYEGELELLVRCAWRGISIQPVAIDVIYFSKNERISHFRPWNDFLRISLLNTVLCCLSIFYGHPRRLFLKIFRRKR
jgi:hypothetical protein